MLKLGKGVLLEKKDYWHANTTMGYVNINKTKQNYSTANPGKLGIIGVNHTGWAELPSLTGHLIGWRGGDRLRGGGDCWYGNVTDSWLLQ